MSVVGAARSPGGQAEVGSSDAAAAVAVGGADRRRTGGGAGAGAGTGIGERKKGRRIRVERNRGTTKVKVMKSHKAPLQSGDKDTRSKVPRRQRAAASAGALDVDAPMEIKGYGDIERFKMLPPGLPGAEGRRLEVEFIFFADLDDDQRVDAVRFLTSRHEAGDIVVLTCKEFLASTTVPEWVDEINVDDVNDGVTLTLPDGVKVLRVLTVHDRATVVGGQQLKEAVIINFYGTLDLGNSPNLEEAQMSFINCGDTAAIKSYQPRMTSVYRPV